MQAFVSFRERYHKKALKKLMFINGIYFNRKVVKKYIFKKLYISSNMSKQKMQKIICINESNISSKNATKNVTRIPMKKKS